MPSPPSPPDDPDEQPGTYDAMLEQLDGAIDEIVEKIENGRIRDAEKEQVRIQYYRALASSFARNAKSSRTKKLEELEVRIKQIEEQKGVSL